jgi:hypothetical protein
MEKALPARFALRPAWFLGTSAFCLALSLVPAASWAQLKSPAERLDELEKKVSEQDAAIALLREELAKKPKAEDPDLFAGGVLTVGNVKLRLGGKVEVLLIDSESESFAPLGPVDGVTDEPDAHLELQRLRLVPVLELNREISIRSQLDFRPTRGDTVLKELVARHEVKEVFDLWWLASRFQVGLDDRFMRPARRTKTYPLIGNAFWRDESLALTWRLTFGDKAGRAGKAGGAGQPVPGGKGLLDALDFASNWGEAALYLSLGQGYLLDTNQTGFDRARFNDLIQDDRELEEGLSLRELGIGLGWRRNFQAFGELGILGFYYNDELRDESIDFLQGTELTVRDPFDPLAAPIAGYGDSRSDKSERWGVQVEYFLPARSVLGGVLKDTRTNDGLRVFAQFIRAVDGELDRDGWYVQGSWRASFGRLLFDRYFRSVEPLVRYGALNVEVPFGTDPTLPGTWDRRELLFGGIVEVTGDIFIKVEYTFRDEKTRGGSVGDDELLVELLLVF